MPEKRKYSTASSVRMALEERLNAQSKQTGIDLMRLRRNVAFDRFLARVFCGDTGDLVLKGSYTLELRLSKARTTKDIDFSFTGNLGGVWTGQPEDMQMFLSEKAETDLQDFFVFTIGSATLDLDNAPYGGFRFPVEALMAGRRFSAFSIDIAAGDVWFQPHELLPLGDWLDFAAISAPSIPVISLEQQFAEKLHSYTLVREYPNSRTKDLVDMILLIENSSIKPDRLRDAIEKTFGRRKTHEIPLNLENPPETWQERYRKMADECGISGDLQDAIARLRQFYGTVFVSEWR